ncbi:MAG: hypothetical protein GVY04_15760 [Cyanobacteria bacterium]|nr:hypothetical protein [Cyanobacteria bacterium GSL.Bin1]
MDYYCDRALLDIQPKARRAKIVPILAYKFLLTADLIVARSREMPN